MEKRQKILSHLKRHASITSKQAFEQYAVTRLAGDIEVWRSRGWPITTELIQTLDGRSRYARYWLSRDRELWPNE